MKYEIAWTSNDEAPRVDKLVFTINANSEREAVQWTESFLGRNTDAPVRALWALDSVMAVSSDT